MFRSRLGVAIIFRGALSGWLAGAVFMLFQVAVTTALDQPPIDPIRLAASIVLGSNLPAYSIDAILLVGLGVNSALSSVYGLIYWIPLAYRVRLITEPVEILVRDAMLYAGGIWLVTTLIFVQFIFKQYIGVRPVLFGISHILVFGPALGIFTSILREKLVSIEYDLYFAEKYRIARLSQNNPHYHNEEEDEFPLLEDGEPIEELLAEETPSFVEDPPEQIEPVYEISETETPPEVPPEPTFDEILVEEADYLEEDILPPDNEYTELFTPYDEEPASSDIEEEDILPPTDE